jgi:hypothetical protein
MVVRIILLEIEDVLDLRSTESIDRLLAIPDHDQPARQDVRRGRYLTGLSAIDRAWSLAQQQQEVTLHAARILKFVD